jgi:hypothetical protein
MTANLQQPLTPELSKEILDQLDPESRIQERAVSAVGVMIDGGAFETLGEFIDWVVSQSKGSGPESPWGEIAAQIMAAIHNMTTIALDLDAADFHLRCSASCNVQNFPNESKLRIGKVEGRVSPILIGNIQVPLCDYHLGKLRDQIDSILSTSASH